MSKPNILLLDVETAPGKAYIWSMWDKFVPLERLIEPGRILCAAWKWYGAGVSGFVSEWFDGREAMLNRLKGELSDADAVVTYNGDKFDLPRLNGEFVQAGIEPVAPVTSIDLYKVVKKLGYMSGKLEYVAPLLDIGEKTKHAGFKLWRDVLAGDETARSTMERYNVQDVRLLARLYKYLRPYISNHPHLQANDSKRERCPNCGGTHLQHRGYRYTRTMKTQRLHCQDCGSWSSGTRSKVK